MVLSIEVLPRRAQELAHAFTDGLTEVLGDDLVSLFTYGSAVFGGWPANDFDSHAFLTGTYDAYWDRIDAVMRDLGPRFGMEFDSWFIPLEQARGADDPTHVRGHPTDDAWALHRAHIHAGKFVLLHGTDPREIVPPPTEAEIHRSLLAVYEDCTTSSYHGYAVLNLCRLWCSLERDDVVLSKRDAFLWGMATLPDRWHAVLLEAARWYARGESEENEVLAEQGPRFIEAHRGILEQRLV